ncbi:MAG: hypothetical protein L0154_30935 [Chloroflexi bacterium]|nr:hypothetical protein [Chloroflexota bacterium]
MSKPIQGIIVVVLACVVGFGLMQLIRNNEDEGFLGTKQSVEITAPAATPDLDPDATPEPDDGGDGEDGEEEDDERSIPQTIEEEFLSPLGADINVVFQGLMFLGLLTGVSFAVRKDFTTHRNIMTFLIIVNWFSILGRMTDTFDGVEDTNVNETLVYVHAGLGGLVMLFASYLVIRMWFENQLPDVVKINPIKFWMRLTLATWLAVIVLGLFVYLGIYG